MLCVLVGRYIRYLWSTAGFSVRLAPRSTVEIGQNTWYVEHHAHEMYAALL